MSLAQFTKLTQKHIVASLTRAVATERAEFGIDKKAIQKVIQDKNYHTAIQSKDAWNTLKTQFNNPTNKFKMTSTSSYKELDPKDKIVIEALKVINSFNFDEFATWIVKKEKLKTKQVDPVHMEELIHGVDTTEQLRGYYKEDTGNATLILSNVKQSQMLQYILEYSKVPTGPVRTFLEQNLQAGHITGSFTLKLANTLGVEYDALDGTYSIPGSGISSKDMLFVQARINSVFRLIADLDGITSNLSDINISMLAEKAMFGNSNPHAITEIQLSWLNQASGQLSSPIGSAIDRLSKVVSGTSEWHTKQVPDKIKKLFESLGKAMRGLDEIYAAAKAQNAQIPQHVEDAMTNKQFLYDFINEEASTPFVKSIGLNLANMLEFGKALPVEKVQRSVSSKLKIPSNDALKIATKKLKEVVEKIKQEASTLKSPKQAGSTTIVKKIKQIRDISTGKFTNLANLQALLNQALSEQIRKNMGTGGQRRILNYETGRFASSAKVERLSESRQGMITAFYTYMKYPYQTFEPGFAQGAPASRDPKLLISKSIREIASTMVGNRMRAVSV